MSLTSDPDQAKHSVSNPAEIFESRCSICTHPYRRYIDSMLRDKMYTLQEILTIANTITAKDGLSITLPSLSRHKSKHLINLEISSALQGFDPSKETLADFDSLTYCLALAISPLSTEDFMKFNEHYKSILHDAGGKLNPPIWTVERFTDAWLQIVKEAIPDCYAGVRERYIKYVLEKYPEARIQ